MTDEDSSDEAPPSRTVLGKAYDFYDDHLSEYLVHLTKFGLKVYAAVLMASGVIGMVHDIFSKASMPEKAPIVLTEHFSNSLSNTESCYYIDPSLQTSVSFEKPETNYLWEFLKWPLPFLHGPTMVHEKIGSIPVFKSANCAVLNESSKLTWPQAQAKASEFAFAFGQSSKMVEIKEKVGHKAIEFRFETVPALQ